MPRKRKNRGRKRGKKGRQGFVQCSACGKLVPIDKAKKVTRWVSIVEPSLAKELKKKGAFIPKVKRTEYYCISCAVFRGIASPRSKLKRKLKKDGMQE